MAQTSVPMSITPILEGQRADGHRPLLVGGQHLDLGHAVIARQASTCPGTTDLAAEWLTLQARDRVEIAVTQADGTPLILVVEQRFGTLGIHLEAR